MPTTGPVRDRVARLLADGSLEMTGKDVAALSEAQPPIPAGTRMNVTFLGNEDLAMRVAAVQAVLDHALLPIPHLSARRLGSLEQLEAYLARLQEVGGSQRVFVVGGDPATPEGPFRSALDLIRSGVLAEHGVREVGITGYPEGHPDIDAATLWQALADKTAEIADQGLRSSVITQFAFDADAVVRWIRRAREEGITAPVRVGVPGPAGIKRLLGFARRFGVRSNATIVRKYGFSLTNLMGSAGPDAFVDELAERIEAEPALGEVGLHLYTFGGVAATAHWMDERMRAMNGAAR